MQVFTFKNFRIVILLIILAYAAIYTKQQRLGTTLWYQSIPVVIFPINGDGDPKTARYIRSLSNRDFKDIDTFFVRNAKKYQLITPNPIITSVGETVESHPPTPPEAGSSTLSIMLWSMKLRYWVYKHTPDNASNKNRIRLYVLYYQGKENSELSHSLGIQKGLIGIIHAYASKKQAKQNSIVMAHEILHTVGASDKYDLNNNQPIYPQGYAKPKQSPLFPQRYAEIMAGRTPISQYKARMPKDLRFCIVGEQTAKEINWLSSP